MVLVDLSVSWARVGLLGFGGGPAMVPLMKAECVDLRGWMTEEQFVDALAIGYGIPGPISAKMSVYVGLMVAGLPGAAAAFVAVMAPTALIMAGAYVLYARIRDNPYVGGAMTAVKPVVIGLLLWTCIELAPASIKSVSGAMLGAAAVAALALKIHPAIVIACGLAIGAIFMR